MKLSIFLLFVGIFGASASVYSQEDRVSLNIRNQPLADLITAIKTQTSYSFLFDADEVDTERKVSITAANIKVKDALANVLKGQGLESRMSGSHILIVKVTPASAGARGQREVSGVVQDAFGQTIVGATIVVKGTTEATQTDDNGKFRLIVPRGDAVLIVSFVGMQTAEVPLNDQLSLTVTLENSATEMDEVVVTALGIQKEAKTLSYNVQKVDAAAINTIKDANFVNGLAGKVAGVTINSSASGIGGAAKVVMRGTKSISGNNNALYVVDGIPLPSLQSDQPADLFTGMGQTGDGISNINPEDIESLSVLSGPAAAALYGSEAANGVVVITTKKGQKNNTAINVSNSTLFYSPFVTPSFQHSYGSEEGSYYSWGEKLANPSSYDPLDFFQTGYNTNNAVSVSTGSERSQTYVSLASINAEGIVKNNNLDRYNFSFRNTTSFLDDRLTMDLSAMYMDVREQNMLAQGQYFNPLIPVYLFPRGDDIAKYEIFERYDPERNFQTQYWPYGNLGLGMQNPYWIVDRDNFINRKKRYMTSAALKFDVNDWLNIAGRAKLDQHTAVNERKYSASTDGIFADRAGAYYKADVGTQQIYADVLVNMEKRYADISLTGTLGASLQDIRYSYSSLGGDLQSVPNLFSFMNLNLAQAERDQRAYHDQTQAIFGTVQAGYKDMVYLDVTARNDWPSALANTATSSIFYPSVGLSAVVTDILGVESKALSFLKARVSYSEVGNAPQRFITIPTNPLVNGYPNTTTFLPNPAIEPERTKSWEAGFNSIFWHGKLKLDATLYHSSTFNQLFNPTLSATSGYSSFYVNAGRIDNKGIEAMVSLNQDLGKVDWTSSLVYSLNRNTIKQLLRDYTLPDGETISMTEMNMGGTASYRMMLREGHAMGDLFVNTLQTDEHGYIVVDIASQSVLADVNNFIYAGNANPLYTLGFRNGFSWKGLDFQFLVNARVGGVGVSVTQALMDAYGVSEASASARDNGGALVNGIRIPAREYYQIVGGGTSGIGSMYVYSATNVRLAEMSLGYDVPIQRFSRYVKGANVSLIGRNLFMFYNKAPFDPEVTASTGTYYQGIDYFMSPSLRNLGFSVKLRF